jgi:phosphatidylglycerophosphate synthase
MSTLSHAKADLVSRPPHAGPRVLALPVLLSGIGLLVLSLAGAELRTVFAAAGLTALLFLVVYRQAARSGALLGWPNRVTLSRAGLVSILAAALIEPSLYRDQGWAVAGFALLVLALDGLDGWLARRLDECSDFGARFDMEVDAALIMVLCLGTMAADLAGPWVLLIGLMRYAFVLAGVSLHWLDKPLPPSFRRKLVCVWQVSSLVLVLTPIVSQAIATVVLMSALVALAWSFAVDVAWLRRHRASRTAT